MSKDAVKHLERIGVTNANYIVGRLVEAGFIEGEPMSEPERLAEGAKKWLGRNGSSSAGSSTTFNLASGWSTDSWRVVMNDSYLDYGREYQFNTPTEVKWIFEALVILAKEAKVL